MAQLHIVHSLQRLFCKKCGAEAHAACNCGVDYEVRAAQKEAHRIASRKHEQKKAEEKQRYLDNQGTVENVEEFPVQYDIPQDAHKKAFLERADLAMEYAKFDGAVDDQVRTAARKTALAWSAVAERET